MLQIDTEFPTVDINPADRLSWNLANVSLDIDLTTTDPLRDGTNSGIAQSRYVITQDGSVTNGTNNCTTGTTFTSPFTHYDMAEGTTWIHICTRDTAGNVTTDRFGYYLVDLTDPVITDNYDSRD